MYIFNNYLFNICIYVYICIVTPFVRARADKKNVLFNFVLAQMGKLSNTKLGVRRTRGCVNSPNRLDTNNPSRENLFLEREGLCEEVCEGLCEDQSAQFFVEGRGSRIAHRKWKGR